MHIFVDTLPHHMQLTTPRGFFSMLQNHHWLYNPQILTSLLHLHQASLFTQHLLSVTSFSTYSLLMASPELPFLFSFAFKHFTTVSPILLSLLGEKEEMGKA